MKHMAICLLLLFALVPASHADVPFLKGLDKVDVHLEPIASDAAAGGLDAAAIKQGVEKRLNAGSVHTANASETDIIFDISINTIKGESGSQYAYYLTVSILEQATISRFPTLSFSTPTWSKTSFGYVSTSRVADLAQITYDYVDLFISDYRAANPPAKAGTTSPTNPAGHASAATAPSFAREAAFTENTRRHRGPAALARTPPPVR